MCYGNSTFKTGQRINSDGGATGVSSSSSTSSCSRDLILVTSD